MKKLLPLTLIFIFIFSSCSRDDEPGKTDEEYLVGTWTVKKTNTFRYLNEELDSTETKIFEEPYSTLSFDANKNVAYTNSVYTNTINGQWVLNEKILKTDLKINLSASTGYNTLYIFPENTIVLLNDTELVLRSPMSLEVLHWPGGDKTKYYSETYLEKL